MVTAIRRHDIAAVVLLLSLSLPGIAAAKEKPEIVRLDAVYLDALVKINVNWQSLNPVTVIRAIVGKELKELKVDAYDNRRTPDGYSGEAVIVVSAIPHSGQDVVPYVVQVEDDLRQKSEQVTGSVKIRTEAAGASPPGGAGGGTGVWTAAGAWTATGTGPPPGGGSAGSAAVGGSGWSQAGADAQGGGGFPSAGDAWFKAGQGKPGELIDKAIGFVAGTGSGGTGGARGTPSPPSGAGSGGVSQTLQNESFTPGGKVAFVDGLKPGDGVAVVLGPVDRPFKVTKILFLFGGSSGKGIVTLKLYRDSGGGSAGDALFAQSFEVQGTDAAFQEVDLAQLGGAVGVPGGSVRVSIEVQHAGLPAIGYETGTKAVQGRNWINRSGAWSDFGAAGIPGNGIIRTTVER